MCLFEDQKYQDYFFTSSHFGAKNSPTSDIEFYLTESIGDNFFERKDKAINPDNQRGWVRRVFSKLSKFLHSNPGHANGDLWNSKGPDPGDYKVSHDAHQSRLRRALIATLTWDSLDFKNQYSEIELKFILAAFVAVNAWSWWRSAHNNKLLIFARSIGIIWEGTIALTLLMRVFNFTRKYLSNVYYDSDSNIGDAAVRYSTQHPYIQPGNFLRGGAHTFFKKNIILPVCDSENKNAPVYQNYQVTQRRLRQLSEHFSSSNYKTVSAEHSTKRCRL